MDICIYVCVLCVRDLQGVSDLLGVELASSGVNTSSEGAQERS
jgi:hypothetical protein